MKFTAKILDQMNANSLYHTLGIRIDAAGDGKAQSYLKPHPDVCWPFPEQPHGGVLFTMMDTTMAWAVWSLLDEGHNCATINLDIHYIIPAKSDTFLCKAWCTHNTQRSSFVRADIYDQKDNLVAMGQATFRIIKVDLLNK